MKSKPPRRRKFIVQVMRVIHIEQDYRLIFTFQGIEFNGKSIFLRIPGLQHRDECLYILQMHYLDDESKIYGKLLINDAELIECVRYLLSTINI